jgi:hypothetical protein
MERALPISRCARLGGIQCRLASRLLLRARRALEDLAFSYRNSSELTDKLRVLGNHEFWLKLETAEKMVRPLCTASFRLQRDENTVADVVISYMETYRGFASTQMSDSLTGLVEARWNACEQPLFMLFFFILNTWSKHASFLRQCSLKMMMYAKSHRYTTVALLVAPIAVCVVKCSAGLRKFIQLRGVDFKEDTVF